MEFPKRWLISPEGGLLPAKARGLILADCADVEELRLRCGLTAKGFEPQYPFEEAAGVFVSGRLVGLYRSSRQESCVSLEEILVDPEYRRQGLGGALTLLAAKRARCESPARFLCAEAHPKNIPALLTLLKIPFMRITALRLRNKKGLRYLMTSDADDSRLFSDFKRVPLVDVYGVSRLLALGYASVSVYNGKQTPYLWLGK